MSSGDDVYSSVERDAQAAMDIYTRELAYVTQVQCDEAYAQALAEEDRRAASQKQPDWQSRIPPFTRSQQKQNQHSQVYEQRDGGVPPDVPTDGYDVQFDELYAQALAEEDRIAGSSYTQSQQNQHSQVYEQTDGGMAPDVLTDDYDELLRMEEQIGDAVNQGLNNSELDFLPTQVYSSPVEATASSRTELAINKHCAICQENFTSGENLRTLPCLHRFHQQCMDAWLKTKAVCPVCKLDVKEHLIPGNI